MQNNTSAVKASRQRGGKFCLVVLPVFIGSLLLINCGGSEEKGDGSDESLEIDSGVIAADAGITENTDASIPAPDAGIIENTDAGIAEDDAGIDDAGTEDEDIEFIGIPSGSFVLSHKTTLYDADDTVQVSAFELKKTPVTVAEFEKCVTAGACTSDNYKPMSSADKFCNYNRGEDWKNHPMNCVNWYGAKEYCEWIGGRLPTEEEWEYAATHNGTKHLNTTYPWGDDAPTHCVTAQYYDVTTKKYCQGNAAAPMSNDDCEGTSDVSLHSPAGDSPLGLVDMSGNVGEWTGSLYANNSGAKPVIKGGSFYNEDKDLSVSLRAGAFLDAYAKNEYYGFRCAK